MMNEENEMMQPRIHKKPAKEEIAEVIDIPDLREEVRIANPDNEQLIFTIMIEKE